MYQKGLELRGYAKDTNIPLEKIYLYQAIRYVDRFSYLNGQKADLPIEFLFQVKREDANLPLAQRSDLVWRNWAKGIAQVESTQADIENGTTIDIPYLQKIHVGFYAEEERDDTTTAFRPGAIKPAYFPTIDWKLPTQAAIDSGAKAAQIVDDNLKAMGLRPQLANEDDYLNKIIDVRGNILYPAAPKAVNAHFTNLLKLLNTLLAQGRENKPMIWQDRLFTPMQLAYFTQQYFVQIHGFHDGNGRISRYWQDVVLAVFGLPAGASGDLNYNDMTADPAEYYSRAMKAGFNELLDVEKCYTRVYMVPNAKGTIPYDCRLLK